MNKPLNLKSKNLNLFFMGTPEIGANFLEHLISSKINFSGIITRPDKPKGRSSKAVKSPVKEVAEKYQIPVYQPGSKLELTEIIKKTKPDLVIVGAFGMIIPKEAIDLPKYKMINFHPSLLPLYRGPSPVTAPIVNGEPKTGVTIMLISEGMDEGDILSQKELPIENTDTTITLSDKLAKLGAEMTAEIIPKWINGEIKPQKQNHDLATYTKMTKKDDGRIDWNNFTAKEIEQMSRAFEPWPGIFTYWNNKKLDLYNISVVKDPQTEQEKIFPGTALVIENKILIKTKVDYISPKYLKIEGKNKITSEDFSRGYPDFNNSELD